jgi:zinc transporter ZupT
MWEVNVAVFESQEFVVGLAVAAILLSALVVSSLFRNVALALAAGAVVWLYLQGGVPNLLAISKSLETEFRAIPDFSRGLMVGLAMAGVLLFGVRHRGSSSS